MVVVIKEKNRSDPEQRKPSQEMNAKRLESRDA